MMETLQAAAEKIVKERARCKTDALFLADQLGYDFQWETHAELFACFPSFDEHKAWVDQSQIKDVMVLWSRGHYKTTAVKVKIIQAILNHPNVRILIMQGSISVTKTFLKEIAAHFTGDAEGSRLRELFPEFCGTKGEDEEWVFGKKAIGLTAMQFTTCARTRKQLAQATVTVASPKSISTGQHYDLGCFDDLMHKDNYQSPTKIEKVRLDFVGAQPLIDPGCYRWVTGTRYAFGDLYEQIQRQNTETGKWVISIKDCWTDESNSKPDNEKVPRFPVFTKRTGEKGGFSLEGLLELQHNDPANFACQYLNQPIHSSQQVFTKTSIEDACLAADNAPPMSDAILQIDLASSSNEKSDDSVVAVGKVDSQGFCYLVDMIGGQWMPTKVAEMVIYMALKHRPHKICLENSAAGQIFKEHLTLVAKMRGVYLPIEMNKVNNLNDAKNMRVMNLAGAVGRKTFKFLLGVPNFDRFIEQALEFPKGRYGHDDYPDTIALLYQELARDLMVRPIRPIPRHTIIAMMHDADINEVEFSTVVNGDAANVQEQLQVTRNEMSEQFMSRDKQEQEDPNRQDNTGLME